MVNINDDAQRHLRESETIRNFQDAIYDAAGIERVDRSHVAHAARTEAVQGVSQDAIQKEVAKQEAMQQELPSVMADMPPMDMMPPMDEPVYGDDQEAVFMASLEDMMPPEEPDFDPNQFDVATQRGLQQ